MLCPVTAILPAYERIDATLHTLRVLHDCDPRPAEFIVHADGGSAPLIAAIRAAYPDVIIMESAELIGPGGGRNRMIRAASHELVANFDDDSFPEFPDYFARVMRLADRFPDAAIFSASSMASEREIEGCQIIPVASGCGSVFRKSWFARTTGFVPMRIAYGMEEVDVSLQLFALKGYVVHDPDLRVIHDHDLPPNITANLNATLMANAALFPFLRFPACLWPVGILQLASRDRKSVV